MGFREFLIIFHDIFGAELTQILDDGFLWSGRVTVRNQRAGKSQMELNDPNPGSLPEIPRNHISPSRPYLILGIWQCWRYPRTGKMLNSCLAESEFRKNFCGTSYAAPNAPNMTPKSHARARFHNPKCVHTPAKTMKFGNCTWRKVTFITISYNNCYPLSRVTRIAKIQFLNTLMAV